MYRMIAISLAILGTAAATSWLAWNFLVTPAMETTPVIPVAQDHAYQFVAAHDASWESARDAAAKLSWKGHRGYLATIENEAEYQLVLNRVFSGGYPDVTYLGGRQTAPGEWRWVTGPSGAADGGKGRLFWRGGDQGMAQGEHYAVWMATAFQHGGKWDVSKVCCVTLFSYGIPQFSTSPGHRFCGGKYRRLSGRIWRLSSAASAPSGARDRRRLPASDSSAPAFPGPTCADPAACWADWPSGFRPPSAYGCCRRCQWIDPCDGLSKKAAAGWSGGGFVNASRA